MLITDSMVTLGAYSKGRPSSAPVLHLCRRLAALDLAFGFKCIGGGSNATGITATALRAEDLSGYSARPSNRQSSDS